MITFEGREIALEPGQTLLAGLEAAGIAVETSCRAGACQSCLMQVTEGSPPKRSQQGLSHDQVSRGLFMPCVCVPEGDLVIARAGEVHHRAEAEVESLALLSPTVLLVRLRPLVPFPYRPGQFVRLIAADGLIRCYSIASTAGARDAIEFHVRLIPGGKMSERLRLGTSLGDRFVISGPSGECYYDGIDADRPMILAGAGTGLAPLWGVLNDALAHGHRGSIRLYHGAVNEAGLYLRDELNALARRWINLEYHPCLLEQGEDILAKVSTDPALRNATIFLCGDYLLVERMRKSAFLAGAKLADIRADSFRPGT